MTGKELVGLYAVLLVSFLAMVGFVNLFGSAINNLVKHFCG